MHFAKSLCPLSTVFLLQSCHRAPLPPQSAPAPLRPPNIVRRHHSRVLSPQTVHNRLTMVFNLKNPLSLNAIPRFMMRELKEESGVAEFLSGPI